MIAAADTIAAIATPAGRGGIAIVRVSGPRSASIARAVSGFEPRPRYASYRPFLDAAGAVIDRGLVLYLPGPGSYTGEHTLELHGHGGPAVSGLVLARVLELGARLARPGEFTERAFLNGKLDLAQAEAVADLVDSLSEDAARGAVRSLEGEFSQRVRALVTELVLARAHLEGSIDFVDEELDVRDHGDLHRRLAAWRQDLESLTRIARRGRLLRDGLAIVIAGRPNAGKSSLLNVLAHCDRAIVDASPGTTRDTVSHDLMVGGIRATVMDTAGIRKTDAPIEAEGVRRTLQALATADLVLLVTDSDDPGQLPALNDMVPEHAGIIRVRNKIDIDGQPAGRHQAADGERLFVSARNGDGIEELRQCIHEAAAGNNSTETGMLARARHVDCLEQAAACAARALTALADGAIELAAEDLRCAQNSLGSITGEVTSDDLLGEIFTRFCIGK